jgi:hypothetical protein
VNSVWRHLAKRNQTASFRGKSLTACFRIQSSTLSNLSRVRFIAFTFAFTAQTIARFIYTYWSTIISTHTHFSSGLEYSVSQHIAGGPIYCSHYTPILILQVAYSWIRQFVSASPFLDGVIERQINRMWKGHILTINRY